jgi:hypothetical protein
MNVGLLRSCCITVLISSAICLFPSSLTAEKTQAAAQAADIESRRTQLLSLFDEEWQYELRCNPEMATSIGDTRYNDRLSDRSPAFYQSDLESRRKFLERFEALNPAGLSAQDALSRELMIRNLRQDIEEARFKPWEMPVNQMNGPHLGLLETLGLTPFNTVKDYDDYLSRLHQLRRMLDQVTSNMRQGMKDGLMQPRYFSPPGFPTAIRSGCDRPCWTQSMARFFPRINALPHSCVTITLRTGAPNRESGRYPMAQNGIASKSDA